MWGTSYKLCKVNPVYKPLFPHPFSIPNSYTTNGIFPITNITITVNMKLTLVFAALLAVAVAAPAIQAEAEKRQDNCGICWEGEKLCWDCTDGTCGYDPSPC